MSVRCAHAWPGGDRRGGASAASVFEEIDALPLTAGEKLQEFFNRPAAVQEAAWREVQEAAERERRG